MVVGEAAFRQLHEPSKRTSQRNRDDCVNVVRHNYPGENLNSLVNCCFVQSLGHLSRRPWRAEGRLPVYDVRCDQRWKAMVIEAAIDTHPAVSVALPVEYLEAVNVTVVAARQAKA